MKLELASGANFLVHLLRLGKVGLNDGQLDKFRSALIDVLRRRYRDHWFQEKPFKGSGYRCLRINGKMDPALCQAAEATDLNAQVLHRAFPTELTMWIDPKEVSYRIGENGSICVLYESSRNSEAWKPSGVAGHASPSLEGKMGESAISHSASANNLSVSTPERKKGSSSSSSSSCKDSMRRMDYLLDTRQTSGKAQLEAYVSS